MLTVLCHSTLPPVAASLHSTYHTMPPKPQFSIPMSDTVDVETHARKSKRTTHSKKAVIPLPPPKPTKSGRSSGWGQESDSGSGQVPIPMSGRPSHGIDVIHPLQVVEEIENDDPDLDPHDGHIPLNVCIDSFDGHDYIACHL